MPPEKEKEDEVFGSIVIESPFSPTETLGAWSKGGVKICWFLSPLSPGKGERRIALCSADEGENNEKRAEICSFFLGLFLAASLSNYNLGSQVTREAAN